MTEWDRLAQWWIDAGVDDPVYQEDVLPLLHDLIGAAQGTFLDVGCGEGHVMESMLDRTVVGCDATFDLLRHARRTAPVVRCVLPDLAWLKAGAIDLAYAVFVLEHVAELGDLFAQLNRVVRLRGALVVVANHPAYTPPGAGPVIDQSDGEVLWRWGPYFSEVSSREPAGPDAVTFHHRSMSQILSTAARARWHLEEIRELGLGPAAIAREPGYAGQEHMPRLLGVRWRRL